MEPEVVIVEDVVVTQRDVALETAASPVQRPSSGGAPAFQAQTTVQTIPVVLASRYHDGPPVFWPFVRFMGHLILAFFVFVWACALPPLVVCAAFAFGEPKGLKFGKSLRMSILWTLLLWLPGVVHACFIFNTAMNPEYPATVAGFLKRLGFHPPSRKFWAPTAFWLGKDYTLTRLHTRQRRYSVLYPRLLEGQRTMAAFILVSAFIGLSATFHSTEAVCTGASAFFVAGVVMAMVYSAQGVCADIADDFTEVEELIKIDVNSGKAGIRPATIQNRIASVVASSYGKQFYVFYSYVAGLFLLACGFALLTVSLMFTIKTNAFEDFEPHVIVLWILGGLSAIAIAFLLWQPHRVRNARENFAIPVQDPFTSQSLLDQDL